MTQDEIQAVALRERLRRAFDGDSVAEKNLAIRAAYDFIAALDAARGKAEPFQSEVHNWMLACFGADIAADQVERVALLRQQNADGARVEGLEEIQLSCAHFEGEGK